MTKKKNDDQLRLSDRQKGILAAMLWEEARGALGEPDEPEEDRLDNSEYVQRIHNWSREGNNVDRETYVHLDEESWPEVRRIEALCTTISDQDNGPSKSDFLIVFEDICVRLRLRFPEYNDDECNGYIGELDLHPAPEADAVWDDIQQSFVKEAVAMAMERLPRGAGFERVLRAAAELQSKQLSPGAKP